jgi:hypothetical protein
MNYFSKFFRACEIFIVEISTSRRGDNKKVQKNLNHMYLYYVGDSNIINKCFYNIKSIRFNKQLSKCCQGGRLAKMSTLVIS